MKKDAALRVEEYRTRLPRLKERVIVAVALMMLGVIMLTTVSFAWITLAVNPEVSNISTSIASNGNLEIALASGTRGSLTVPGATQLGDGNLPVVQGNLTWGNLINLSDPSYGLSNIVLRPAGLNKDDLLGSPLYGADYDASGKHDSYIDSFAFAKWQSTKPDDPNAPWEFTVTDELGVRAISSTTMAESSGYAYDYKLLLDETKVALREAQNAYLSITNNVDITDGNKEKQFLESLAAVMGAYMTSNMNAETEVDLKDNVVPKEHLEGLRDMFNAFIYALELEQEAMRHLANLQLFVIYGGAEDRPKLATVEAFLARYRENQLTYQVTTNGTTKNVKLQISGLSENLSDLDKLKTNYDELVKICQKGGEIKWQTDGLNNIVNALVNVSTCTVNGTRVSSIGATAALDLNNTSCDTVITNGVLYNFEKRTGAHMDVPHGTTALEQKYPKGLPVKATGRRDVPVLGTQEMTGTIYANITTNAPSPSLFQKDINYAESQKNTQGGALSLTANDTYGFAIDFWVRTNASGSFLTLEGNVLIEKIEKDVMGTDGDGNEVQLYVNTINTTDADTGEEISYTEDIYQKDGKWYYAGTNTEYESSKIDNSNPPKKKVEIIENVIGYEGENRVWEDNAFLSIDSTTQGSGSCYVYYYNTPEDMERSLKLLSAMKIAFVDAEGNLMAEGFMDTEHYFDDNGKVIVPMVLAEDSITIKNPDGTETLAITNLDKNVAKLVTAIVYLDGTKIENKDVLAVSEIQGQMNIQFGSSVDLNSVSDEKLAGESMSVSASVDKTTFNYDESKASGTPMTTNVGVTIEGTTPGSVTAFFVRSISATQGIPMNGEGQIMEFTDQGGGKWASNFTFTMPGTYVLRSIWVDGIEYDLEPSDRPTVVVEGFTVSTLSWASGGSKTKNFLTAASSISDTVALKFVTEDVESMPSTVEGRFLRTDGNSVNVKFKRNTSNDTWYGDVSFLSSGDYTLEFLVFNGEYFPIENDMQLVAKVNLGMKVAVYTDSPLNFVFGYGIDENPANGMAANEENLIMKIKIFDDTGAEMKNLDNVKLYYALAGYKTEVNGLDADMEWNPVSGYYEGQFNTKPGVFEFLKVTAGDDNTIQTATTYPRFVIISPNPPEFDHANTVAWQYSPNNDAEMIVHLAEDNGIDESGVIAIITNGIDTFRVGGTDAGDDGWHFKVPTNAQGTQDGTWTLERIEFIGIFHDGKMTTEDDPYVIELVDQNITTTVLSTIKITTDKEDNISFDGEFLQEHTINNDTLGGITIVDKNGNALPGMDDTIELVYTYGKDSVAKGGYTINFPVDDVKITLEKDATGTYFALDTDVLFKYAGTYTLSSLSFTFDGGSGSIPVTFTGNDLPEAGTITVSSTAPSVKITDVSPTGTFDADTTGVGSGHKSVTVPAFTSTNATVYFKCSQSGLIFKRHNYSRPSVTITLSNIGNASSAELSFGADSHVYNGTTKTGTYYWEANGKTSRNIGYYQSKTAQTDDKTPAGTITATVLTLKDAAGNTYTVDITDITINNPY